jgi:uncharacterized protein (DUF1501 family)
MKRRDFLKNTTVATAPLLINGIPLMAAPSTGSSLLDMLAQSSQSCGKVLVIIQQNGGNDGLNTVLPIDIYSQLSAARANVILPQASILPLNGTTTTGLHPALAEMKALYDSGKVTIVQAVSYPNPNFSHFRATDIWFSGSPSNETWDTGWLGRTLDTTYPNYPQSYPNPQAQDPLAIQIGSSLPFSLQGPNINMGYNVPSNVALTDIIAGTTDPAPNNDYGRELTFLRLMTTQSNAYRTRITNAYNAQATQSTLYPAANTNRLADQLKTVARLIGGGLTTPIYVVNHPNTHDTHEGQVAADRITGAQYNNLSILSKAIAAFQDDIERMGKADKVTGMTFSEFGRRVKSNDSIGTDHGTAAPVFFFGAKVQGGIIGTSPTLPTTITSSTQVPMQYDFRQLYTTVMQDWLCLTPSESATVLGGTFSRIGIFQTNTPLPLEGVTLTGQYYDGVSRLSCRAQANQRYVWYALEFSTDGQRFTEVGRKTGTSAERENYEYRHEINAPKMYYRIKAQDQQGATDYSNTVMLRNSDRKQLIRIYPNPVTNNNVHVEFFENPGAPVEVTIYDVIGAKHYYNRFSGVQRHLDFRVPAIFSRETHYILEVIYGDTRVREQIIFR